jgi:hypothetical protein
VHLLLSIHGPNPPDPGDQDGRHALESKHMRDDRRFTLVRRTESSDRMYRRLAADCRSERRRIVGDQGSDRIKGIEHEDQILVLEIPHSISQFSALVKK